MTLSTVQRGMFAKARRLGTGATQLFLDDNDCRKLVYVAARDLGIDDHRIRPPGDLPAFYDPAFASSACEGPNAHEAFTALVENVSDGDLYFYCLAALHLRRLKYARILATQPMPTMDQVGPRALLQFGHAPPTHLAALLLWRKWIYDIDNRAAQETGYIFEPIIAASIGGSAFSAKKSPVRSRRGGGRQVDCIREADAYELKLRVTIAASGQGRWGAELEFPGDCRASGFRPVLLVFDPTENPKLTELKEAFKASGGTCHVGAQAWQHLEDLAGQTMGLFLDLYVRAPLASILEHSPSRTRLPELILRQGDQFVGIRIGAFEMKIDRADEDQELIEVGEIPSDVEEEDPGRLF